MLIGSQVPRHPKQENHHLHVKTRQLLGQCFFICMVLMVLWSIIGGFVSYFYVKDFITEYCTDCIKEQCGCDDLCTDSFNGLKTFSYVTLTFSILVSVVACTAFARWTQILLNILEEDDKDIMNGLSLTIQQFPIPDLDPYCCCWCPGVKHCYTKKTLKSAADDIDEAADEVVTYAFSVCEAFAPFICVCCVMTVYIVSIVICYSDLNNWVQVVACIIAFIIYVLAEGSG